MKRRHFLQAASTTLGTIGLSQLDFLIQADRTHQALAQPGSRKLALLVGINAYAGNIRPLNGCVTDIQMQYELLRHRYGFNPADILVLTDNTANKPTRNNILAAFEEHLIKQAKPGDTVIFHYSGHGAIVFDPDPIPTYKINDRGFNGTIVPMDAALDNRNDIMGKTLFLLSRQVNTENFTMVLDSCHSGGGTRGNHIIRSVPRDSAQPNPNPSPAELNYQDQQMVKLNLNPQQLLQLRTQGIAKGIAIGAAKADQYAIDASFGDFNAGALSYLLTRYLWQLPAQEDITTTFDRLALITQELAAASGNVQEPIKDTALGSPLEKAPIYNLTPTRPSAEGVIRSTQVPKQKGVIEFWLGGVVETSLKGFASGSLFTLIDDEGKPIGELEQIGRSGLVGYGKLKSGTLPKPGTLLREKLRNLPSDITLTIGLYENLGDDRDALAKALNAISQINAIPVNQRGSVNFIIGRLTDEARTAGKTGGITISQPNDAIGLFTPGYDPIDSSLFGGLNEPVTQVIDRLRPKLKLFLAREYLTRMVNGNASELNVEVLFKSQGHTQTISNGGTRSLVQPPGMGIESSRPHTYKLSPNPKKPTQLDISLTNKENNAIYTSAIQIATDGVMTILHPSDWNSPESAAAIKPGATHILPLEIIPPAGYSELLVITSTSPLRESLKGLQTIARGRGMTGRSAEGYLSFDRASRSADEPEESVIGVTRSLVADLTRAVGLAGRSKRGLNANQCAIYSQLIHTIE